MPTSSRGVSRSCRRGGRAGRAGFDTRGYVLVQAPEHEIENPVTGERLRTIAMSTVSRSRAWWAREATETVVLAAPESGVVPVTDVVAAGDTVTVAGRSHLVVQAATSTNAARFAAIQLN